MEKKRGRPPKKDYNPQELMEALSAIVSETYAQTSEIKATATELKLPPHKVKKLLITSGCIAYLKLRRYRAFSRQENDIRGSNAGMFVL